jgi:hypothetical protein
MAETFNCPTCGAPLETDGKETTIHCEYCGETVIVPQSLRTDNAPAPGAIHFPTQPDNASAPGAVQFPTQPGQPFQPGNFRGRMDPSQLRQMMIAIRAGQLEDAVRLFQGGTGVSESQARQTVELISNQLSGSNRILPAELAALMMGAMAQSTMGAMAQSTQNYSQPLQPTAPVQPRRRSSLGCLAALIIIALVLYFGYTAISPTRLLSSLLSGNQNNQVRQTAVAPLSQVQTALATEVGSMLSGGTEPGGSAAPLLVFGGEGIGQGLFKDARSIAIDGQGRIYTGEYTGGRVQVFDSQGKFLAQWMVDAKTPLLSLAVSPQGTVYIVQGGKIRAYEGMTGKPLGAITVPKATLFNDVVMTASGKLAASENGSDDNILIFDTKGSVSLTITKAISGQSGNSELDARLTVDGQGNIYALGSSNNAVFKFSQEGKFLNRFGSQGNNAGQFQAVEAIAVDGQGQVYVSDIKGIQVFDPDGRYLKTIQLPEGVPFGMAFDQKGNLFVTNRTKVYESAVK